MTPSSPSDPMFRPNLLRGGTTDDDLRAGHRRSELQRIRPGAYLPSAAWTSLDLADQRRMLVVATVPKLGSDSVVSHLSAARLHGLPVPDLAVEKVHVSRNLRAGGFNRAVVHSHSVDLLPTDIVELDGVVLTSVARTVADTACVLDLRAGVAMADEALQRNMTTVPDLSAAVSGLGRRSGISRARRVVELADRRSESVGESNSKVCLLESGLPIPILQMEIRTGHRFVARTDFCWPAFRVVGEFDGKIKFGRALKPGEAAWREKLREDAIRRLGWVVVRWTWADLATPQLLEARIREALALGVATFGHLVAA